MLDRVRTMNDDTTRIANRLQSAGTTVSDAQLHQLGEYLALLRRWNARMNLTALDEPDSAVDRLIVEPVVASAAIDASARVLVDIGSGGGSPAIPLKVARPELALTMIEVKTRKSVFLREVVRHLGLVEAIVETGRFEQGLSRPAMHGTVDVISIRAVRADSEHVRLFGAALRSQGQQLWFLSGGQPQPDVVAPLEIEREIPLVAALDSRLLLIRKHT
ncbi:16S rRNA (guanine(527)-N(7))-methyltransferase RsmG [Luteitalea sp.]